MHWRRERLPTPVFLGFLCCSAGKESTCNAGDLGSILGLGRSPGEREKLPTPVFWPGEFHGLYSPRHRKESDMTEWLSQEDKSHKIEYAFHKKKKKKKLFELNTSLLLLLKITYMAKIRYYLLFSVNFSNSWVQLSAHFLAHIKTENIATEKTREFSIQAAVATQCLCWNVFFLAVCPTAPHERDDFILLQSHNCPGQRHEK